MARNEEKAQSMLYRFREAQAAELGLGTRSDRRPRMASACKSLRECERWRGEILREISRKVSKIQDAGLTNYEVRDLNDEINKLLREKRHWENQIVALGGANYRRNVAMLDDDGKEVPGTKGYKYFGRAKELPGVKELFQSRAKEEDEENQAKTFYKKFLGQDPSYYGDADEKDAALLKFELSAEEEEWEDAYLNVQEALQLPDGDGPPPIPRHAPTNNKGPGLRDGSLDEDTAMSDEASPLESSSAKSAPRPPPPSYSGLNSASLDSGGVDGSAGVLVGIEGATEIDRQILVQGAQAAAAYISFLSPEDLLPPKLPTKKEMEDVLLNLRKKALVEEYFGE